MSRPEPDGQSAAPSPDAALREFFAAGRRRALDGHDSDLWNALERAAEGGKRFRPALLMGIHDALGGAERDAAAQVAAAIELLHTAFVVHDDVIDGDHTRRGRPNVSGSFARQARQAGVEARRAAHFGDAAAILAGDLALAGAVRAVALCGASPAVVRRLLDLMDRALHVTAAGEFADVRLALDLAPATLDAVLRMEERKTAVYSFELPLQAGAVLAGADERAVDRLGELGRLLGLAFQLRDDVDGAFGDEAVTGKSSLSDLREGKCTPLVAHARTTPWWPLLAPQFRNAALDDDGAAYVRELLVASGSRRFIEDLARDVGHAAREVAVDLALGPDVLGLVEAVTGGQSRRAA